MKKYVKNYDACSNETCESVLETVNLDSSYYDIESDSEDTYYTFDSLEEYREFLKKVGAD